MIIGINKTTRRTAELYPFYENMEVSQFIEDLDKHAILSTGFKNDELSLYIYGHRKSIKRGEVLIIYHVDGVYSGLTIVTSIEAAKSTFLPYNGNQAIGVQTKDGTKAMSFNPMCINPCQLFDAMRPLYNEGIKLYGTVVNESIISVDKISHNGRGVSIKEPGFMFFSFSEKDGELVMDATTRYTFFSNWKLNKGNEWLQSCYNAMHFDLRVKRKKKSITVTVKEDLDVYRTKILMQRLGFVVFSEETTLDEKTGKEFSVTYLIVNGIKVLLSEMEANSLMRPYFKLEKNQVIEQDINAGRVLNRLGNTMLNYLEIDSMEDSDEAEIVGDAVIDFFKNLLVMGFKNDYSSETVTSLQFKDSHTFSLQGDIYDVNELKAFSEYEDIVFFEYMRKNRIDEQYVMNNIYVHGKDVSL